MKKKRSGEIAWEGWSLATCDAKKKKTKKQKKKQPGISQDSVRFESGALAKIDDAKDFR